MCLTDEAEQFIDEFISNIEDTDFSSFEDEKSESSSSFGLVKSQSSQSTTVPKSVPVEMDGVMLPWLQWETPDDTSAALTCLNKLPHTPNAKLFVWESDPSQVIMLFFMHRQCCLRVQNYGTGTVSLT